MAVELYGDITPRTAAWATVQLEKRGIPYMAFEHLCQSRPIPRNVTNVVKFRRYESIAVNATPLVEGVTPSSVKMSNTDITATLSQYGTVMELSDVIMDTHEDRVLQDAMGNLGENAAVVLETVREGIFVGGTNVIYNANAAGRTTVASKLDRPSLRRVIQALRKQYARQLTQLLGTDSDFNTVSLEPAYWAVAHTDLESSIRDLPGFKSISDYAKPPTYDNELGGCENVRFLLSQLVTPFLDAGGTAGGNFKSNGGTSCDVYPILYFARDACGIVPLKGEGAITPMVVNAKPTDSDPMAQRTKVSWKAYHTAAILNQNWLVRHEVACPV
jgi:N4-gp56 family major capsid protein